MQHWLATAITFYNENKINEAERLFLSILRENPAELNALNYLSIISYRKKEFTQARKYCEAFLKIRPDDPEFLNRLGQIELFLNNPKSAFELFKSAINHSEKSNYLYNLARASLKLNNIQMAIHSLEKALKIDPESSKPRVLLMELYLMLNDSHSVKKYVDTILRMPGFDQEIYLRISEVLLRAQRFDEADPVLLKIIKHKPDNLFALYNLGILNFKKWQFGLAIPFLEKAFKLDNSIRSFRTLLYLIYCKRSVCEWIGIDELIARIESLSSQYLSQKEHFQLPVYVLNYLNIDRKIHKELSSYQSKLISMGVGNKFEPPVLEMNPDGERKLRIGYISTKFNISPGGILFKDVFSKHNKFRFETFGYTLKTTGDFIEDKFRSEFDNFVDLSKLNDEAAAERIYKDHLDILITMAGHSDDMRLAILAARPAPVQINWEGYNESIGGKFIDYSILDETLIEENTLDFYEESIIKLPGCAMFNSPLYTKESLSKKELGIPENKFVFGCLNHPKKITHSEIEVWSEILLNKDNAVLLIYDGRQGQVAENLAEAFRRLGINRESLIFTGKMDLHKHWSRFKLVDLFLDTFQVNGHTTIIEALRLGVPAISIPGINNYSRYGTSILNAVGLPELVCNGKKEYVEKALYYSEFDHNNKLKIKLAEVSNKSVLFNIDQNIKNLEKAFEMIRLRKNNEKTIIDVT